MLKLDEWEYLVLRNYKIPIKGTKIDALSQLWYTKYIRDDMTPKSINQILIFCSELLHKLIKHDYLPVTIGEKLYKEYNWLSTHLVKKGRDVYTYNLNSESEALVVAHLSIFNAYVDQSDEVFNIDMDAVQIAIEKINKENEKC